MMCRRLVRFELDRPFNSRVAPVISSSPKKEYFPKRGVCFGQVGINPQSFQRGLFRFRLCFSPIRACIKWK